MNQLEGSAPIITQKKEKKQIKQFSHYFNPLHLVSLYIYILHYAVFSNQLKYISKLICDRVWIPKTKKEVSVDSHNVRFNHLHHPFRKLMKESLVPSKVNASLQCHSYVKQDSGKSWMYIFCEPGRRERGASISSEPKVD